MFRVGDEVLYIDGHLRNVAPRVVKITKVGRKYVSVDALPRARFDRETGSGEYTSCIRTREKHAAVLAERDAVSALLAWGVALHYGSPARKRAVAIFEALKPLMPRPPGEEGEG